jgi:F-type H+-transporting ATPase subunit a
VITARRAKLVPSRPQMFAEWVYGFVRNGIVEGTMGLREGERYVPFLATMLVAIFCLNATGVIPGLNIAGTSVIGIPLLMALTVFVVYLVSGIRKHGAGQYFKQSLVLPGVPAPMHILLVPLEALQLFVTRPFSLTIRLLANMVAGHFMLIIFTMLTHNLFFVAQGPLQAVGVLSGIGGLAITFFELFVAALQAYIFTMLSAVYIQMSLADEH